MRGKTLKRQMIEEGRKSEKKKKKKAEVGYENTSKTKKAVERLQTLMRE